MLPSALLNFLSLWFSAFDTTSHDEGYALKKPQLTFELRHQHAVSKGSRVVFSDIPQSRFSSPDTHGISTRQTTVYRPESPTAFHRARLRSIRQQQSEPLGWTAGDVSGPDVNDRETLLELAKMTNNAYLEPDEKGWYELGNNWTVVRYH